MIDQAGTIDKDINKWIGITEMIFYSMMITFSAVK